MSLSKIGFKDVKGKDVYKGDIIKYPYKYKFFVSHEKPSYIKKFPKFVKHNIGFIEWIDRYAFCMLNVFGQNCFKIRNFDNMEVIGNINTEKGMSLLKIKRDEIIKG